MEMAITDVARSASELPVHPWQEAFGLGLVAVAVVALVALLFATVLARGLYSMREERRRDRIEHSEGEFLDTSFLDNLASSTPPKRLGALLQAMVRDCRGRIHDIRAAAREGDLDRLQVETAALAESCEAFGATGLAVQARALFFAVRDQAFDEAGRRIIEIESVAHATFEALGARAAGAKAAAG